MTKATPPNPEMISQELARLPTAGELACLAPEGRLAALSTVPTGLTSGEAARRLQRFGPNEPIRPQRKSLIWSFVSQFVHTLALLLWFASGLAFAAGSPALGGAILAVVTINGVFAFAQGYRADQIVESLMRRVALQATVLRDGDARRIAAADLVPGDIVRIVPGEILPADGVLLDDENLTLDQSMITGETVPVQRTAAVESEAEKNARLFDLVSIVPAGAAVITGTGHFAVFATGTESTMGKVASLVEGVKRPESLLEQQVAQLSGVTAVVAVMAGTATLILAQVFTQTTFLNALTFATGAIVALVPEGLLPTLSVSLAMGASRMAARGGAIRRLSAVEVVGSVTVICTDKTGTLTENTLDVLGVVGNGMPGVDRLIVEAAVLCNDAEEDPTGFTGDPLDVALLRWARKQGAEPAKLRAASSRIASTPFDSQSRYMSVTCDTAGQRRVFIKGAPEAVVELTGREPSAGLASALDEAMANGERVLLLAMAQDTATPAILGLVRFFDPPRAGVLEALLACRRAGVRVAMLTGDHPATARSLAQTIGFPADSCVLGYQLEAMSDAALLLLLQRDVIFARIDPAQKLRIVKVLEQAGEVVVVTGDGINDAPALRAADVGIAMGRRGTEVAKQAADVVLSDDNFATIVAAIEEGRAIRANIRRFVSYVFTSNVAELVPFLIYVFLPVPLPLAIIQVLAIDLGTDLLPALALGTEPASPEVMSSRPEPPGAPLLSRNLFVRTFLFYGPLEALLGLGAFFGYYLASGWQPFHALDAAIVRPASTLTFLGIVSGQIGCLFASRDGTLIQRLSPGTNKWVAVGLVFELLLALAIIYTPGLKDVFSMAAVSPAWLAVLPIGAAVFVGVDQLRRLVDHAP